MASGKTTIGGLLAKSTNKTFVDTDQLLEKEFGTSITEFFSNHGEEMFRQREELIIQGVCQQSHQIICSGGGAFISEQNQHVMLASGIVFWLDVDRDTVLNRIKGNDNETRPLLSLTNQAKRIDELLSLSLIHI